MNVEILKSIQDWLGPIRKQMEAGRKAAFRPAQTPAAAFDPEKIDEDLRTRNLITRIKYAGISRAQRDSLCGMVRSFAGDGRLDRKMASQFYKMITLLEALSSSKRDAGKTAGIGQRARERSVDDEMELISVKQERKTAQDNRLQALQSSFSTLA